MSDNFEYGESHDIAPKGVAPESEGAGDVEGAGDGGVRPAERDDEVNAGFSAHSPRVMRSGGQYGAGSDASSSPMAPQSPVRRPVRRGKPRARRMNLSLTHCDAWSVAKVTFLLGVAGGIIQVVATALIWALLNVVGVFDQVTQIVSSTGLDAGGFNLADVLSMSTVLSAVTIFSIIEVILITLLATIGAWLYNVVSALVGGVHVTLGDD